MMATKEKLSYGEFGAHSVWFTAVDTPMGTTIEFTATDPETGEEIDTGADVPFDCMLAGTVSEDGTEWAWDGEGSPHDWRGNTITAITAYRKAD